MNEQNTIRGAALGFTAAAIGMAVIIASIWLS